MFKFSETTVGILSLVFAFFVCPCALVVFLVHFPPNIQKQRVISEVDFLHLKGRTLSGISVEESGSSLVLSFEQGENFEVKAYKYRIKCSNKDGNRSSTLNQEFTGKKISKVEFLDSRSLSIFFDDGAAMHLSAYKYSLKFPSIQKD